MLDAKIEELEEKGFDAADYKARKEKLKDSLNALTKIRKELHLKMIMLMNKYSESRFYDFSKLKLYGKV